MDTYICLDTEATGLSPKHDKIIEIGAVRVDKGVITDRFSTYVNPGRKLSKEIIELTGITDEDLKDAPTIDEIINELIDFLGDYPLVGHHIISDYAIIKQAAVNNKCAFEKEGSDTLKISRACLPGLPSKKLFDVCAHYGIELKAHRAFNDAEATAELYERLKKEFMDSKPELFKPMKLNHKVKKETPIRKSQVERIKDLVARYNIDCPYEIEKMSCNEASRYIDIIRATYGDGPRTRNGEN